MMTLISFLKMEVELLYMMMIFVVDWLLLSWIEKETKVLIGFFFRSSRLARVVNLLMENPNYFLLLGWLCCSLESLTMICLQLFNVILRIVELCVSLSDSYKEFTSYSQIHIVMNPDYRKYIFSSYYKSPTN